MRESMAQWSKTGFLVQHWQAMLWESEADLYAGEGASAWERVARDSRKLKDSHLVRAQFVRILTKFVKARSALASWAALPASSKADRLADAQRAQRELEREDAAWAVPLAAMVAAGLAKARGDVGEAERFLRKAVELAGACNMSLHAAAARHRLGLLLGGDQGAAMVDEAEEAMKARGVRVPERYAQMLVPGTWRPAS